MRRLNEVEVSDGLYSKFFNYVWEEIHKWDKETLVERIVDDLKKEETPFHNTNRDNIIHLFESYVTHLKLEQVEGIMYDDPHPIIEAKEVIKELRRTDNDNLVTYKPR